MSFPRYVSYKNAGPGWLSAIPEHWSVVRNKSVLLPRTALVGRDAHQHTLLSLTLKGVVARNTASGKGKYPAEFDTYKVVEANNLVFCLFDVDETPRTVGLAERSGMVTGAYEVFAVAAAATPRFLHYFYLHVDKFKGLRPWYTGLRKVVRPDAFGCIKIPLPPPAEQISVAAFLDHETTKIDALIQEQQRLIELLKEKRQAVISQAVTKGIDQPFSVQDSGSSWLGNICSAWKSTTIRRVAKSVLTGGTPPDFSMSGDLNEGLPWYTPGDWNDSLFLTHSARHACAAQIEDGQFKVFPEGAVLIVSIGATLGRVGLTTQRASANQQINAVITSEGLSAEFLAWSLSAREEMMRTLSNSSTIGIMNQEKTKEIAVAIPPTYEEQQRISEFLRKEDRKVRHLITASKNAISLLQERRSALISAAVTGKIDLRNYNPQPVKTL